MKQIAREQRFGVKLGGRHGSDVPPDLELGGKMLAITWR